MYTRKFQEKDVEKESGIYKQFIDKLKNKCNKCDEKRLKWKKWEKICVQNMCEYDIMKMK